MFSNLTRPDLADYCPASNLDFNERVRARIAAGEDICHLAFGQSPFPVPELARRSLAAHAGEHAYLPVPGLPELRELICGLHRDFDRVNFSPQRTVVGPGSKELLYLTMNVFNGDLFLLAPTWTTYLPQTKLAGNRAQVIRKREEDAWKVTAEKLEQEVARLRTRENAMLILCNPDNPTGACLSREDLQSMAAVCRRLRLIVVEDEIYARTHYRQDFSSLAEFYPEGTIVTSGFSKWSSMGGWRVGYALFPESLAALHIAVRSAASHTYSCAPAPMQYALIEMLSDRTACLDYMRHTSRVLATVAEFVRKSLTDVRVSVVPAQAGYYVMPNFECIRSALNARGVESGVEMCDLILRECRVALMAGTPAFLCADKDLTVRLCFVDFDGERALEESRRVGLSADLTADFVERFCDKLHRGIQRLCRWVAAGAKEEAASK